MKLNRTLNNEFLLSPQWTALSKMSSTVCTTQQFRQIKQGLNTPPHNQKLLLRPCLSLNCSNTAVGLFYFLPVNLGQELEACQVLESRSKTCPGWAVAIDSLVTLPKDDSHVSVCSCFDRAEHEQDPPGDPRADLLRAAGCHSPSKACRGLEQGFVGITSPPAHHHNTQAQNSMHLLAMQLAACSGNEALSKGSPDGHSL